MELCHQLLAHRGKAPGAAQVVLRGGLHVDERPDGIDFASVSPETARGRESRAVSGRTHAELRGELAECDFSMISPGDQVVVWAQQLNSGVGRAELPLLAVTMDQADVLVDLIFKELTRELENHVGDDVFIFYNLVGCLAQGDDADADARAQVIKDFESGVKIEPLQLLRIGRGYEPSIDEVTVARGSRGKRRRGWLLKWTN